MKQSFYDSIYGRKIILSTLIYLLLSLLSVFYLRLAIGFKLLTLERSTVVQTHGAGRACAYGKGSRKKSQVIFLVARPLRPYPPPLKPKA